METKYRFRNNDLGPSFPTSQERASSMMSAQAAPKLSPISPMSRTPHTLNSEELRQTMAMVEEEAASRNAELIQMHSGLNAQRVARLLDLLD